MELAARGSIACAALEDGQVVCWGGGGFTRKLFPKVPRDRWQTPIAIPWLKGSSSLSIAWHQTMICGLQPSTGRVRCVHEKQGELQPVDTGARQMALGRAHGCAIAEQGKVRCWGEAEHGILGVKGGAFFGKAQTIAGSKASVGLVAGEQRNCIWNAAGNVRCWGKRQGSRNQHALRATMATHFGRVQRMAAARHQDCALRRDGRVRCSIGTRPILRKSARGGALDGRGVHDAAALAVGNQMACAATKKDGHVWCWGNAKWGRLGDGRRYLQRKDKPHRWQKPRRLAALKGIATLATNGLHTCGVTGNGKVWCWGSNGDGELGHGVAPGGPRAPDQVKRLEGAKQLSLGSDFTCALKGDGSVWCWGDNSWGQCGSGSGKKVEIVPVRVALPHR